MTTSIFLPTVFLGIALAACCGFRVFLPLLIACLAARFHLVPLQPGFTWLASTAALVLLVTTTGMEISAYYIPRLDSLLDIIMLPLALAAGAVLSASVLPVHDLALRWVLGLAGGGITAGILHVATGFLRIFSSRAEVGAGIYQVATAENGLALGGTVLALFLPLISGIMAVVLILGLTRCVLIRAQRNRGFS